MNPLTPLSPTAADAVASSFVLNRSVFDSSWGASVQDITEVLVRFNLIGVANTGRPFDPYNQLEKLQARHALLTDFRRRALNSLYATCKTTLLKGAFMRAKYGEYYKLRWYNDVDVEVDDLDKARNVLVEDMNLCVVDVKCDETSVVLARFSKLHGPLFIDVHAHSPPITAPLDHLVLHAHADAIRKRLDLSIFHDLAQLRQIDQGSWGSLMDRFRDTIPISLFRSYVGGYGGPSVIEHIGFSRGPLDYPSWWRIVEDAHDLSTLYQICEMYEVKDG